MIWFDLNKMEMEHEWIRSTLFLTMFSTLLCFFLQGTLIKHEAFELQNFNGISQPYFIV